MQPSQPQQTQPSQPAPGAQPGQPSAQQAPSAPQPGGAPSIDDQVQVLAQELNLSADQQAKVKTALEDQHTQAMGIIQDPSMPREDKVQKIHALREGTIAKVRATLTSDEQKTKFDQILAAQDNHLHQQQPPQQSQPPQPKQ
jgi:hypothetical protein